MVGHTFLGLFSLCEKITKKACFVFQAHFLLREIQFVPTVRHFHSSNWEWSRDLEEENYTELFTATSEVSATCQFRYVQNRVRFSLPAKKDSL